MDGMQALLDASPMRAQMPAPVLPTPQNFQTHEILPQNNRDEQSVLFVDDRLSAPAVFFEEEGGETVFPSHHVLARAEGVESLALEGGVGDLDRRAARAWRAGRVEGEADVGDLREAAFEGWVG